MSSTIEHAAAEAEHAEGVVETLFAGIGKILKSVRLAASSVLSGIKDIFTSENGKHAAIQAVAAGASAGAAVGANPHPAHH